MKTKDFNSKSISNLSNNVRQSTNYKKILKALNYQASEGYITPQDLANELVHFLAFTLRDEQIIKEKEPNKEIKLSRSQNIIFNFISNLTEKIGTVPIYKLTGDLCLALEKTKLTEKSVLEDLKITVPQGLILLPINSNELNLSGAWIYFEHKDTPQCAGCGRPPSRFLNCGTILRDCIAVSNSFVIEKEKRNLLEERTNLGEMNGVFHIVDHWFPKENLEDLQEKALKHSLSNIYNFEGISQDFSQEEALKIYEYIFDLSVNCLLFLQSYPEQVTIETIKKKGFAKSNKKIIQKVPLRTIGENYKIKKNDPRNESEAEASGRAVNNGTSISSSASPVSHWRSGHWRSQPYKSRTNPEYKMKWIEAVWVKGYC